MKKLFIALMLLTASAFAQEVSLPDFANWKMTDISTKGFKKEDLFTSMNRRLIKTGASICSNRALVWAYDFKRFQNIDAGKLFLFYTKKSGDIGQKTWWYHVTPVVNEKGSIFTVDAGFPGFITRPMTADEWFKSFTGSTNCKAIKATDTNLLERMFAGQVYPQNTSHGNFDCYYIYTPGGYWTPASVAKALLGRDETGRPVSHIRDNFNDEEVYTSCVEAVTSSIGRMFGGGKKKCEDYLGMKFN